LLHGEVRPQMVDMLHQLKAAGYRLGLLTNNVSVGAERVGTAVSHHDAARAEAISLFDHVTESSLVGYRKPEVRFYTGACDALGVLPSQCVFLDDLGINLKPAAALGMTTIKVTDPDVALAELQRVLTNQSG
jgi:putative hydrolase of the HAD superfamily